MIILPRDLSHPARQSGRIYTKSSEEGIAKTPKPKGNYYYDFYHSAEKEDEVMLLEKWENQEVLDLHCKQPHYQRIGELKEQYVVDTVIEKYELI